MRIIAGCVMMIMGMVNAIGCSGPARNGNEPYEDIIFMTNSRGRFVGTPSDPMRHTLTGASNYWSFSSDRRFLAVGTDILDLHTSEWHQIPAELLWKSIGGIGAPRVRWAPGRHLLGISCELSLHDVANPPTTMPDDRADWGYPFCVWNPIARKLTVYPDARLEGDFHWLTDGHRIIYWQGRALLDRHGPPVTFSLMIYDLKQGMVVQQKDIVVCETVAARGGWNAAPAAFYPIAIPHDLYLGLAGHAPESSRYEWLGESPRTGDVATSDASPDRLEVRRAGAAASVVATLPRKTLLPYEHGGGTARWLQDDNRVLWHRADGHLTVVDTSTGETKDIASGVIGFMLLDAELYEMHLSRMMPRLKDPRQLGLLE